MKYSIVLMTFSSYLFGAACEERRSIELMQNFSGKLESAATVFFKDNAPLTHKSFQEIFQENSDNNVGTLMALVQVGSKTKTYEAFSLNQKLFNNVIPEFTLQNKVDPESNEPIQAIDYFLLESPEEGFAQAVLHINSYSDRRSSQNALKYVNELFNMNNAHISLKDRIPLFINVGAYYAERGKASLAFDQFKKAQGQEIDKRVQARGYFEEGRLHFLQKDFALARRSFEKAALQDASIGSKESSQYFLALIAQHESERLNAEIQKAEAHLKALISEQKDRLQDAQDRLARLAESATTAGLKQQAQAKMTEISARLEGL